MITDIIKGHINEALNKEDELSKGRMDICFKCHFIKEDKVFGYMCSSCHCRLAAKTRVKEQKCPLNKW